MILKIPQFIISFKHSNSFEGIWHTKVCPHKHMGSLGAHTIFLRAQQSTEGGRVWQSRIYIKEFMHYAALVKCKMVIIM
jgi:hypothetical protein